MKTRFAPSPTGEMHFGNIRTALFNYLVALKTGGKFLLRLEDTDHSRSDPQFAALILEDLAWLGIEVHEGFGVSADSDQYRQSQRGAIYHQYYQQLIAEHKAYPCFCSDDKLQLQRKVQLGQGLPPRYSGECKKLNKQEIAAKIAAGGRPTLRFAVPPDQIISFDDAVRGEQKFASNDIGDFIIQRADGTSPFMFCSQIDDALMGIDLVLRGEDHLTNTPRQLLILQALGLKAPQYGHISLIVNHDGGKFSKRLGSLSVVQLRAQGFLPQAINNYLARIGHAYKDDPGYANLENLAKNFELNYLSNSSARFDEAQLEYWQKQAVSQLTAEQVWQWIAPQVADLVPQESKNDFIACVQENIEFPQSARHYAEIIFGDNLDYSQDNCVIFQEATANFFKVAGDFVAATKDMHYAALIDYLKKHLSISGKALFLPLRVAVTGQNHGPEMPLLFKLLGKQKVLARLAQAQKIQEVLQC